MKELIEKMEIRSLKIDDAGTEILKYIDFNIGENKYYLAIKRVNGEWLPECLYHYFDWVKECDFCKKKSIAHTYCETISNDNLKLLYSKLLLHRDIKLKAIVTGINMNRKGDEKDENG